MSGRRAAPEGGVDAVAGRWQHVAVVDQRQRHLDARACYGLTVTRRDGAAPRVVATCMAGDPATLHRAGRSAFPEAGDLRVVDELAGEVQRGPEVGDLARRAVELVRCARAELRGDADRARVRVEAHDCHRVVDTGGVLRPTRRRFSRVTVSLSDPSLPRLVLGRATVWRPGTSCLPSEEEVRDAAREASEALATLVAAGPAPAHAGPAVLSASAAAVFVHETVVHLTEADNYVKAGIRGLGERVASERLSVAETAGTSIDDLDPALDDEAVAGREVPVVAHGEVRGILTDRRWASRLGVDATGNGRAAWLGDDVLPRTRSTVVTPGEDTLDALLSGMGDGLYVEGIGFGEFDPRTRAVTLELCESREVRRGAPGRRRVGGTVRMPLDALAGSVRACGRDAVHVPSLCQKRGQVVPVETTAVPLLLASFDVA